MIHLNPYYIFGHVIYINVEKKYIFVEKECYAQIHSLVFSGKRSTALQRRKFRQLLYDAYYEYTYNRKNVDIEKFNKKVFDIYVQPRDFDHSTSLDNKGDTIVQEDILVRADDNQVRKNEIVIEEPELKQDLIRYNNRDLTDFQEIIDLMNLYVIDNKDYELLVNYIGFNKCFNIIRSFIFRKEIYFGDEMEMLFIRKSIFYLAKYRLNYLGKQFDFICDSCSNVGRHFAKRHRYREGEGNVALCWEINWFHKTGFLDGKRIHMDYQLIELESKMFEDGSYKKYEMRTGFQIGYLQGNQETKENYDLIIHGNDNFVKINKLIIEYDKHCSENPKTKDGFGKYLLILDKEFEEYRMLKDFLLNNCFDSSFDIKYDRIAIIMNIILQKIESYIPPQEDNTFSFSKRADRHYKFS